jgi:hypothetical protein
MANSQSQDLNLQRGDRALHSSLQEWMTEQSKCETTAGPRKRPARGSLRGSWHQRLIGGANSDRLLALRRADVGGTGTMDRDCPRARVDRHGDRIEARRPCRLDRPLHVAILELMHCVRLRKAHPKSNKLAFAAADKRMGGLACGQASGQLAGRAWHDFLEEAKAPGAGASTRLLRGFERSMSAALWVACDVRRPVLPRAQGHRKTHPRSWE